MNVSGSSFSHTHFLERIFSSTHVVAVLSPIRSIGSFCKSINVSKHVERTRKYVKDFVYPTLVDIKNIAFRVFRESVGTIPIEKKEVENKSSLLAQFIPSEASILKRPKDPTKYALSLLSSVQNQPNPKMNESLFSSLFFGSRFSVEGLFDYFKDSLPSSSVVSFSQAIEKKAVLEKIVQEKNKEGLQIFAQELASSIGNLNEQKPLLLHVSFSKAASLTENSLIRGFLQKALPLDLQNSLEGFGGIRDQLSECLKEFLSPSSPLYGDALKIQQSVEDMCSRIPGPELLKTSLKEDLKELVLGPPGTNARQAAEKIIDRLKEKGLEKTIQDFLEEAIKQAKNAAENAALDVVSSISSNLPPVGQSLLELSGVFEHIGQEESAWLEIKKQPNGKFQLSIFSKETDYHQQKGFMGSAKTRIPLVFSDIEPSALNKEFFYQTVSYQALPLWNPSIKYSLEDFFGGPIEGLHKAPDEEKDITPSLVGSSERDLFDLYMRCSLGLKEVDFQKFLFDKRLDAFLQMWSHIKGKEDCLQENESLSLLLQQASDKLAQDALFLHQKGFIALDKMGPIASTLVESDSIIHMQKKRALQKSNLQPIVLPAEMQQMMQNLMKEISPNHIASLRSIFIEIFGKEVEEPLDAIIDEVVKKQDLLEPSKNKAASISWKQSLSFEALKTEISHISSMRFSLLHMYRFYVRYVQRVVQELQYIFSCYLWSCTFSLFFPVPIVGLTASLAFLIISRAVGVENIARSIPKSFFDTLGMSYDTYQKVVNVLFVPYKTYQEIFKYFSERLLHFVLKSAIQSMLSPEVIQSIRASLISISQKTTRSGEISYDLAPGGGEYITKTFPLPAEASPIAVSTPQTLQQKSEKALRGFLQQFIGDLPRPHVTPISSATLMSSLQKWKEDVDLLQKNGEIAHVVTYLNSQIRLLPIPGSTDLWNTLPEKRAVLEQIHELFVVLANKSYRNVESSLSLFTLYAITDFLARQCEESKLELTGAPNGCDIIDWVQDPFRKILNPESYKQLEDVCCYFGFDLKRRYSSEEIEAKRRTCSFGYKKAGFLFKCTSMAFGRTKMILDALYNDKQKDVYLSFLRDPDIRKRVEAVSKGKSEQELFFQLFVDPSLAQCSPENKQFLQPSVLHPNKRGGLLPRSFSLLRFTHFIVANRECVQGLSVERGLEFDSQVKPHIWKWLRGVAHKLTLNRLREQTLSSNIPVGLITDKTMLSDYVKDCTSDGSSSISDIVDEKKCIDIKTSSLYQMIISFKIDQLMRAFGYFQEHYKKLSSKKERIFFEIFVHQIGVLKAQLEENKESIRSLGEFFQKTLLYYYEGKNWDCCYFLCSLGEELKTLCSSFAPETSLYFPDFRKFLREVKAPREMAYALLAKCYAHRLPESLAETEKKEAVFDLCRIRSAITPVSFRGLPPFCATSTCLDPMMEYHETMWLFSPMIKEYLNKDSQLRRKTIEAILHDSGVTIQPPYTGLWIGQYPHFTCGDLSFTFSRQEIEGEKFFEKIMPSIIPAEKIGPAIFLTNNTVSFPKQNIIVEKTATGCFVTKRHERKIFQLMWTGKDQKTYWKEENSSSVLCMQCGEVHWVRPARIEGEGDKKVLKVIFKEKRVHGKSLYEIASSQKTSLALLSWFQPSEDTKTYVDPLFPEKIARIEFPKVSLAFDMAQEDQAVSDGTFPGFYIAKKQACSLLRSFSAYLLLHNNEQEEKVLVVPQPISTLIGTFVVKHCAHLSSSPFIESILQTLLKQDIKKPYYDYSISKEGLLDSSDPEALAYLLLHFYVRGNILEAKKYLERIEDLGKRVPFSRETHELLDGFSLPLLIAQDDTSTEIALRLSSVKMENRLLQESSSAIQKEKVPILSIFSKLEYFLVQIKYARYVKESKKKQYLSEFQELFLLKYIENINQGVIRGLLSQDDQSILNFIKSIGVDTFASHLLILPEVFERQQFLRSKHQEGNQVARAVETMLVDSVQQQLASPHVDPIQALLPKGPTQPSLLTRLSVCFKNFVFNPYRQTFDCIDWSTLNLFRKKTKYDLDSLEHISVELWDLSLENVEQYFLLYYRLSMNALPGSWKGNKEKELLFQEKRERLQKNLKLLHGHYEGFRGKLLLMLQKVSQGSRLVSFTSPEKIEEIIESVHQEERYYQQIQDLDYKKLKASTSDRGLIDKQIIDLKDKLVKLRLVYPSSCCYVGLGEPIRFILHNIWNDCRKVEASNIFFSKETLQPVTENAISFGIAAAKKSVLTALGVLPFYHGYRAIRFGLGLCHSIKKITSQEISEIPSPMPLDVLPSSFSDAMKERESQITGLFQSLFDKYFTEEVSQVAVDSQEMPLEVVSEPSVAMIIEKIKKSISDYYNRPQDQLRKISFKKDMNEKDFREELRLLQKEFVERVTQEQQAILSLTRFPKETSPLGKLAQKEKKKNRLTFEEISVSFAKNELGTLVEKNLIPVENQALIEKKLYLLLVLSSRFQFLFAQKTSSLVGVGEALKKERVYGFEGTSEPILKAKLLFESAMNVLLWKRPMEQLEKMLLSKDEKGVLEALMGWGKSFCLIPLASSIEADRSQLVINIWPTAVAATNIQNIGTQVKKAFARTANAIRCTRNFLPDVWGLTQLVHRTIQMGEQINVTQEDLKSLELQCIEKGLKSLKDAKAPEKEQFDSLRGILAQVRAHGRGIIDEVHKLFDPQKNELNHPLGRKKYLRKEYVDIMGKALLFLVTIPEIKELVHIKALNPSSVDETLFKEKVAPVLLRHMCRLPELNLPEENREEFILYALGVKKEIPVFVLQSKHKEYLGLVKGLVDPLLPMVLQKITNVDYAKPSKSSQGEFARPSEGNENPDEAAIIRNPFEAFLKTGILTLQKGLSRGQMSALISCFKDKAMHEGAKKAIPVSETSFAKLFKKIFPKYSLFSLNEQTFSEEDFKAFRENDQFTMLYAEWIIANQIEFFPQNVKSDPFNFASMFSSFISFTGTPNNEGCFPEKAHFHLDPGTLGESIDVLNAKCKKKDSVQILRTMKPYDVLQEVLSRFFQNNSKATALIDRGALFNGIDPETVAKNILKYVQVNRPSIQGVVYYVGGEQFIWEQGSQKGIPFKESKVPEERRITYFDEPHTYAADIPQPVDAEGIISVGESTTLEQLLQALWRMRKLKRGDQRPLFVMTEKVRSLFPKDKDPEIEDIVQFCAKNEGTSLAQLNYLSDLQKMNNVIRRAILDKILFASEVDGALAMLQEFKHVFVTEVEENPFELYGHIAHLVPPEEVFSNLRISLYRIIENSKYFSLEEKNAVKEDLESIGKGTYPEKVQVYKVRKVISSDAHEDLGRTAVVVQEQSQNQEQQEEEEVNVQVQQNINLQNVHVEKKETPPPFIPWSKTLSLTTSLDWINSKEVPKPTLRRIGALLEHKLLSPPVFFVSDVIKSSGMGKIADFFDSTLMATSNFFQLFDVQGRGRRVEPFGISQKPVFEVVVVQDGNKTKIVLVDQKEAEYFREKLREDRLLLTPTKSSIKIGLYDVKNRTFVATGKNQFNEKDLDISFHSNIAKLCFLDAQVTYTQNQQKLLAEWVGNNNPTVLKDAFLKIHIIRGRDPVAASDIEDVFEEAEKIAYAKDDANPLIQSQFCKVFGHKGAGDHKEIFPEGRKLTIHRMNPFFKVLEKTLFSVL